MTAQPSAATKLRYDALIRAYKAAGLWETRDAIYAPFLAETDQQGRLNLKSSSYTLTVSATAPTFVNGKGYTFSGGAFDTGFNPTTASGNVAQNSCSLRVFVTAQAASNASNANAAGNNGLRVCPKGAAGTFLSRAHAANTQPVGTAVGVGLYTSYRNVSNRSEAAMNGAAAAGPAEASVAMTNANLFVGCNGTTAYTPDTIGLVDFGAGITLTQEATFWAALLNIYAGAASPLTALSVEYSPTQVAVYMPVPGATRFTKNVISRVTNATTDSFGWAQTLLAANTASGWIADGNARRDGEQEFAMSTANSGVGNFVGGATHGYEQLTGEPTVELDGTPLDITSTGTASGQVLTISKTSTIYELGTTNALLTKATVLTFDYASAKVTADVTLTCVGTDAGSVAPAGFTSNQFYVGMDCGVKGQVTKGYMSPSYAQMDLTDNTGEVSYDNGLGDVFMVGPTYGMRCRYLSGWTRAGRREIINDAVSSQNPKIYHNITGPAKVVSVGDVITASVEWVFASAPTIEGLIPG